MSTDPTPKPPHSCPQCDMMPYACKYALVESREVAWSLVREKYSEPGSYWHARYEKLSAEYRRVQESQSRQQLRADRLESALHRANKTLKRYERPYNPKLDNRPWWRLGERFKRVKSHV